MPDVDVAVERLRKRVGAMHGNPRINADIDVVLTALIETQRDATRDRDHWRGKWADAEAKLARIAELRPRIPEFSPVRAWPLYRDEVLRLVNEGTETNG